MVILNVTVLDLFANPVCGITELCLIQTEFWIMMGRGGCSCFPPPPPPPGKKEDE